ncbi:MAG: hypothetical protein PHV02_07190 [Rhodocyclaceae bacterium]|nr:hypothetical protein [Rhodocyclaceae bacterium]
MFDFEKYKTQCTAVAKGFKNLNNSRIAFSQYEKLITEASMLTPKVVEKIEREIITKGSNFRPIDAYQF